MHGDEFFVRGGPPHPGVSTPIRTSSGAPGCHRARRIFRRALRPWNQLRPTRLHPTFGWLSNELPGYPVPTLGLKTMVHQQGRGLRPIVEVEHTDHPLAIEQHHGITVARVRELVAPFAPES